MNNDTKILVYGYGNPGRRDDGMGIKITEMVEEWKKDHNLQNIDVDNNYQLNIEDAEKVSQYDVVIFVDASQETNLTNFKLTNVEPNNRKVEFTMHAVSPSYIIHLCQTLFKKRPKALLLSIKGYRWEFQESLSDSALLNMERAFIFLKCELMNLLNITFSHIKCK